MFLLFEFTVPKYRENESPAARKQRDSVTTNVLGTLYDKFDKFKF